MFQDSSKYRGKSMEKKKRNPKGMGTFKEKPDGTITHRKSVGYKPDGNRKVITVTSSSRSSCIKLMREKENAWKKQQQANTISLGKTVLELCQLHLAYQVESGELKPKSIDRRECTINQIAKEPFARLQLNSVTVADVDDYISRLVVQETYAASSIEKILDVLNAAFNWALIRGELERNPVTPIKPTLKKRIKKLDNRTSTEADVDVLSIEEQELFEKEASRINFKTGEPMYTAGVYGLLLLHTGMRVGEMLALRWSDVDFENRTLNIDKNRSMAKNRDRKENEVTYIMHEGSTKNEKARKIELTPKALEDLYIIRNRHVTVSQDGFVVITQTGRHNTTTNIEHRMQTIYHNAGLTHLKGGVHILRKTFSTEMYEHGARVKEIAAYIGDLESTVERYYIAIRKKRTINGKEEHVVALPKTIKD